MNYKKEIQLEMKKDKAIKGKRALIFTPKESSVDFYRNVDGIYTYTTSKLSYHHVLLDPYAPNILRLNVALPYYHYFCSLINNSRN